MNEINPFIRQKEFQNWESRACRFSDLTFRQSSLIGEFLQPPLSDVDRLELGLVTSEQWPTNLAWMLSDQWDQRIGVNIYNTDGRLRRFKLFEGSLLKQTSDVMTLLELVNLPVIDKCTGGFERRETFPWPKTVLHDALIQTVMHRDYSTRVQTAVTIHPDRITFLMPGGLPCETASDETETEGQGFCRNEKLAGIFRRLGWAETVGTNFHGIFEAYEPFAQKPQLIATPHLLRIVLPRATQNSAFL